MSRFGILRLESRDGNDTKEIDVIIPHITAITGIEERSGAFCFELIGDGKHTVCFPSEMEAVESRERIIDDISDFLRALATGKLCDTLPKMVLDSLRSKA